MLKPLLRLLSVVSVIVVLTLHSGLLSAQEQPTKEDVTIRPTDRITWTTSGSHVLRFGGTVGKTELTPFSEIEKILEFTPKLTPNPMGIVEVKAATGVVRKDAPTSAQFVFTCAVHPTQMISLPFQTAAAVAGQKPREIQVLNGPGLTWFLSKLLNPKSP